MEEKDEESSIFLKKERQVSRVKTLLSLSLSLSLVIDACS